MQRIHTADRPHADKMGLLSRRAVLRHSAMGFGNLAFASMLCQQGLAEGASSSQAVMLPARAKRVIFLFMKGGPSHIDTFDFKPELQKRDGQELPFAKPRVQFAPTGNLLASPWKFEPRGESG